jgi:hypothetical protein
MANNLDGRLRQKLPLFASLDLRTEVRTVIDQFPRAIVGRENNLVARLQIAASGSKQHEDQEETGHRNFSVIFCEIAPPNPSACSAGARQKRNHGKIVPDYPALGKRNQSATRITASQSQLSIRLAEHNRAFDIAA